MLSQASLEPIQENTSTSMNVDKQCDKLYDNSSEISHTTTVWTDVISKRKRNITKDYTGLSSKSKRMSRDPRLSETVIAANPFSVLENDSNEQTTNLSHPPPIHLKSEVDFLNLCTFLENAVGSDGFSCKSTINGVTIFPTTSSSYRAIVKCFRDNKAEFHTYQLSEDKAFRCVIRGLHHSIGENVISQTLTDLGYRVRSVVNVISRNKVKLPLFFVDLESEPNNNKIFELKSLLHCRINVEEPRQKRQIPQCTRCQRYGHTKGYCSLSPRCVKCAENHDSSSCTKSLETPASCVLCGGNHPSNYRGCTVHKELQNRRAPNLPTNQRSYPPLEKTCKTITTSPHLRLNEQSLNVTKETTALNIESFPSLPSTKHQTSPQSTTYINPHREPSISYSQAVISPSVEDNHKSSEQTHISSFITEIRNLIAPMITLMTQLIQVLIEKNASK
jgi:hypothetical protein